MKILFCGDVVGKSGRRVLKDCLPKLKDQLVLDMVIVNGENAAHGFGINPKLYNEICQAGADVITLGNHSFDKADIFPVLESELNIIRPLNYPNDAIGKGWCIFTTSGGVRVAVVQLLGQVFMRSVSDPFVIMEEWLKLHKQGKEYDVLIVDFHAEATAEKVGMGYFLNGKASLVVGTHTHIPTADARILPDGTAFMSDVGMCGDYNSIIGMQVQSALSRFLKLDKRVCLQPAENKGTFCAVYTEIDEKTGHAVKIFPIRIGAILENTHQI